MVYLEKDNHTVNRKEAAALFNMIDLSQWINTATGAIINGQKDVSKEKFFERVYFNGVASLLRNKLLRGYDPSILLNHQGLRIELSERIVNKTAIVYSGINHRFLRGCHSDWPETDEFPRNEYPRDECPQNEFPEDTREQAKDRVYCLLGEFQAFRGKSKIGTITLYTKAISEYANGKALGFEAVFWPTLAHEVFYAFHYHMFQKTDKAARWRSGIRNKKDRELVVNSLAEYFEYEFAISTQSVGIEKLMTDKWKNFDIDGWPASGALGILASMDSDELFKDLFGLSFYDWKTAADIIRTGYYLQSQVIKSKLRY